jgi:hypothetical protein
MGGIGGQVEGPARGAAQAQVDGLGHVLLPDALGERQGFAQGGHQGLMQQTGEHRVGMGTQDGVGAQADHVQVGLCASSVSSQVLHRRLVLP